MRPQLRNGDRLMVVADNCTDATAAVARAAGAQVVERVDAERRGKGYALDFGLRCLDQSQPQVVVMLDADSDLSEGAIDALAWQVAKTGRPAQALYVMAPPAEPKPRDLISALAFIVKNQVRPLGGARLGWPCFLTGTGMAFPWDLIRNCAAGQREHRGRHAIGIGSGHRGIRADDVSGGKGDRTIAAAELRRDRAAHAVEHGHRQTILHNVPRLMVRCADRAAAACGAGGWICASRRCRCWSWDGVWRWAWRWRGGRHGIALAAGCRFGRQRGPDARVDPAGMVTVCQGRDAAGIAVVGAVLYPVEDSPLLRVSLPATEGLGSHREIETVRRKHEIRISKSETSSKAQKVEMSETRRPGTRRGLSIRISCFEFVSDFVLRISDLSCRHRPRRDLLTPLPTITLRSLRLHAITEAECIQHILDELTAGCGGVVVTANLDHLRRLSHDPSLRPFMNRLTWWWLMACR